MLLEQTWTAILLNITSVRNRIISTSFWWHFDHPKTLNERPCSSDFCVHLLWDAARNILCVSSNWKNYLSIHKQLPDHRWRVYGVCCPKYKSYVDRGASLVARCVSHVWSATKRVLINPLMRTNAFPSTASELGSGFEEFHSQKIEEISRQDAAQKQHIVVRWIFWASTKIFELYK
jgi:hypothetical protein